MYYKPQYKNLKKRKESMIFLVINIIQDFMKANPNMTRKDAIKYWKLKKTMPGDNKYSEKDFELDR